MITGLELLKSTGILAYMIPEFAKLYKIKNQGRHHIKDAWNHTLEVVSNSAPTVEARLAALLHDIGKSKTMTVENGNIHFNAHQFVSRNIARRFMTEYKYTLDQTELVTKAVELHMNFLENMLPKTIRRISNEIGKDTFLFAIDLAEADSKRRERISIVQSVREFVLTDNYVPEVQMKLPVNGDMIMKRYSFKPGKFIGTLLDIEKEYLFEYPAASEEEILAVLDEQVRIRIV
jgi:putative nucleotidyltransferase with HDIG domain